MTVTLDDALLAEVRREADRAGKSMSRYLADLLAAEQERLRAESIAAMAKFLALADYVPTDGEPWKFNRDEVYDRPYPGGHKRGDLQPRWPSADKAEKVRGVAERIDENAFDGGQPAGVRRSRKRRAKKDSGAR